MGVLLGEFYDLLLYVINDTECLLSHGVRSVETRILSGRKGT